MGSPDEPFVLQGSRPEVDEQATVDAGGLQVIQELGRHGCPDDYVGLWIAIEVS